LAPDELAQLQVLWNGARGRTQVAHDKQIENVYAIHEHQLASLGGIGLVRAALVISPPATMKA
jgi:hypothetical protein